MNILAMKNSRELIQLYLGEEFYIDVITNLELPNLDPEYKEKISSMFKQVCQEQLNDLFGKQNCDNEIDHIFQLGQNNQNQIAAEVAVILKGNEVIGACSFEYKNCNDALPADTTVNMQQGHHTINYWLQNILQAEKYVFVRNAAIAKEYRNGLLPFILEKALAHKMDEYPFLLTAVKKEVSSFKWCLSRNMIPVYFDPEREIYYMGGTLKEIMRINMNFINNYTSPNKFNEINENIDKITKI